MYETLSSFAQTWGLVLFVVAFILVLVYALNPKNSKSFEEASEIPLKEDEALDEGAGRKEEADHGRS